MTDAPVTFARRIADLAIERGDQPAITVVSVAGEDESHSWAELHTASSGIARLLQNHGAGVGDLVAICLPNGFEHVATAVAALKVGATVFPIRWDLPEWERDRLLAVGRPGVVVTLDASASMTADPSTPNDVTWQVLGLEDVRLAAGDTAPFEADDVEAPSPFAIGTGGSTGVPKIVLSQGGGALVPGLAHQVLYELTGLSAGLRQIVSGPLYHSNALMLLHRGLFDGDQVILLERFDAATWVRAVEQYEVDFASVVPTMMRRIINSDGITSSALRSLKMLMHTAGSCSIELKRRWIELLGPTRIVEAFGSTEEVGLIAIHGEDWLRHEGSIGKPFMTDVRILDEAGQEVGPGVVGLIYMRPAGVPTLAFDYLGSDAPSIADGYVTVGDMGWVDNEGWIYYADRRHDLIVSGGANVYPAEVEAALAEHPAVFDLAVVGVPDSEWGQSVHAFIQLSATTSATAAELDTFARGLIAAYKVPKTYTMVDDLPRDAMGKVRRGELARRLDSLGSTYAPA